MHFQGEECFMLFFCKSIITIFVHDYMTMDELLFFHPMLAHTLLTDPFDGGTRINRISFVLTGTKGGTLLT